MDVSDLRHSKGERFRSAVTGIRPITGTGGVSANITANVYADGIKVHSCCCATGSTNAGKEQPASGSAEHRKQIIIVETCGCRTENRIYLYYESIYSDRRYPRVHNRRG